MSYWTPEYFNKVDELRNIFSTMDLPATVNENKNSSVRITPREGQTGSERYGGGR